MKDIRKERVEKDKKSYNYSWVLKLLKMLNPRTLFTTYKKDIVFYVIIFLLYNLLIKPSNLSTYLNWWVGKF